PPAIADVPSRRAIGHRAGAKAITSCRGSTADPPTWTTSPSSAASTTGSSPGAAGPATSPTASPTGYPQPGSTPIEHPDATPPTTPCSDLSADDTPTGLLSRVL